MALPNIFTNDYVDHDVLWNGAKLFDANGTFSGFEGKPGWLGEIKPKDAPRWSDNFIMLIFGGLPWQAYFQRVLSSKTLRNAQIQSILAGIGCLLMAIPPIFIGAAAKATDWDSVFSDYSKENNLT